MDGVCATHIHSAHRANGGDQRTILRSCSNVNNSEKFHAQSLQQLQYTAMWPVLLKKNQKCILIGEK